MIAAAMTATGSDEVQPLSTTSVTPSQISEIIVLRFRFLMGR
jgi:hypothetical protein